MKTTLSQRDCGGESDPTAGANVFCIISAGTDPWTPHHTP